MIQSSRQYANPEHRIYMLILHTPETVHSTKNLNIRYTGKNNEWLTQFSKVAVFLVVFDVFCSVLFHNLYMYVLQFVLQPGSRFLFLFPSFQSN